MNVITLKDKDTYVITFDCSECATIIVSDFHMAKMTCKLRLGEFLIIKHPFKQVWYVFELPLLIQDLILKLKNKIQDYYEKADSKKRF